MLKPSENLSPTPILRNGKIEVKNRTLPFQLFYLLSATMHLTDPAWVSEEQDLKVSLEHTLSTNPLL